MEEVVKALADIAARLERIEAAMKPRQPEKPVTVLSYTPREAGQKIGRSYRWIVDRCAAGIIPTVSKRRPYLIPAGAFDAMFSSGEGLFVKPSEHALRLRGFKPKAAKKPKENPLTQETATDGSGQQSTPPAPSETSGDAGLNSQKAV